MGALGTITAYTVTAIAEAATSKSHKVAESLVSFDSTFTIKRFDGDEDLKNSTQRQVLYIPKIFLFKAWDLIIHTPPMATNQFQQVVFIQISTKSLCVHDAVRGGGFLFQNSLNNPMDPNESTF